VSRSVEVILVKTRNLGDQILLRYQADYLQKLIEGGAFGALPVRLHVLASHAGLFEGRRYEVESVNRTTPQASNWLLFKKLLFSGRQAVFVFYATNRNRVILGVIAKLLRLFVFARTLILSYDADFLAPNVYSEFSFRKARGVFRNALFRDFALTLMVEKILKAVSERHSKFRFPGLFGNLHSQIQQSFDEEITKYSSPFALYHKLGLASKILENRAEGGSVSPSSPIMISPGASQEPKMIDAEMVLDLINIFVNDFGKRVVVHRSPILAPHEQRLFEKLQNHRGLKELVKEGQVEFFENKSLAEFEKRVRECSLYIGADSGPKHLAISTGALTLSFDYSCPMKDWHFYDLREHMVLRIKTNCRPNYPAQWGYEWCGLDFCDHLSCHKIDRGRVKKQIETLFSTGQFDPQQAYQDFPELRSFQEN